MQQCTKCKIYFDVQKGDLSAGHSPYPVMATAKFCPFCGSAQQSVHLTASGAGGRGQNSLQSSFIADDQSAKHGGR